MRDRTTWGNNAPVIQMLRNLTLATVPALVVCFLALEVFFRTVLPAAEVPRRYMDPDGRIVRFDTAGPREGLFTRGRFAEVRARWRINNYGWNSAIDFQPAGERKDGPPLIAIIGDSYLNGFQVDPDENMAAVLRRQVEGKYEVYRFGTPGAPLSQYMHMSRYVDRHFEPDVLVFNVVHNDFHLSLTELSQRSVYLQVELKDGGFVEIPPSAEASPADPLWSRSALFRYLKITLQSYLLAGQIPGGETQRFVANIPVDVVERNRDLVREATHFLVGRIREENLDKTIVFVMDAPRVDLYSGNLEQSGVRWLNDLMAEVCREYGIPFVDLRDHFSEVYRRDGLHFESEVDAHWNEVGHREAALALYQKFVEIGLVRPTRTPSD